jgi:hypothetical protein
MTAVGTTGMGATTGLSRHRGALVSTMTMAAAIAFGEAVIVGLTGASRHVAGGANPGAWALATVLNAVLGFYLLGLPQIRAWETGTARTDGVDEAADPRTRLAARSLSGGGRVAFFVASVIGGPPAIGWFYGRRRDPRARSLTWTAAWILGSVWSAVYLGLLAWIL